MSSALAVVCDRAGASSALGLVTALNSAKTRETRSPCRGLTRLGARALRQGAFWMEKTHGKDQVTFCTVTVPAVSDGELKEVTGRWHDIVNLFVKRIRYQLEKHKVSSEVIHVTEIQAKRSHNSGQEVPHLHLVFKGRNRKRSWAITPKQIQKYWKAALKLPFSAERGYSATTQLARVRKSVCRYLSKYLAKSRTKTRQSISRSNSPITLIKSWWGCTNSLRKLLSKLTLVLHDDSCQSLWRLHEAENRTTWEYQGTIENPWDGGVIVFCRFGRLTPAVSETLKG